MLPRDLRRKLVRAFYGRDDDALSYFYGLLHHDTDPDALAVLDASGDYRWQIIRANIFGMPKMSDEEMEAAVDAGVRQMFGMLAERLRGFP